MKKFNVNVPEELAQEFEKKLHEMQSAFGGKLEISGYRRALDESLPIMERCKTFEDAVAILGNDNQAVIDYYALAGVTCTPHILAYAKLAVIAEALNEGWKPQFTYEEYRYFPWFTFWWEQELEGKSEEWKKERNITPIPAVVGGAFDGSNCGVSPLDSYLVASLTSTHCGGALATWSSELAVFFGKQFIEIWIDYLVGNPQPAIEATAEVEEK